MIFMGAACIILSMLMIRLQRVGKRNDPSFRVVLTDSRNAPQSGRFLEILGSYNPQQKQATQLKAERITHWLSKGAQASDTVHNLLINNNLIQGNKRNAVPPSAFKVAPAPEPVVETPVEPAPAEPALTEASGA